MASIESPLAARMAKTRRYPRLTNEAERVTQARARGGVRPSEALSTPASPLTRRAMRALATTPAADDAATNPETSADTSAAPTRRSRIRALASPTGTAPVAETETAVAEVRSPEAARPDADAPAVSSSEDATVSAPAVDAPVTMSSGAAFGLTNDAADESASSHADAFEHASKLFAFTDEIAITDVIEKPTTVPSVDDPLSDVRGSAPRKARSNFRKIATAGFSVSVMGVIGAFALSMSMPFLGASAAQPDGTATAAPTVIDDTEIQAFVASSEVQTPEVDRASDYSQVTAAQIADETGISYSSNVFTNDRTAAIQWPFAVGVDMSYGYGMRDGRLHEGIDFTPGAGAPIQNIADGVVRIATENGGNYGVTVYVDHVIDGEVITSHYSHMQYGSLAVVEGQEVKVGDLIGLTGNTGRSFGAHLHFELIVNGSTIDPMPWMKEHAG